MATTRNLDDTAVPAMGWFWLLAYALFFSAILRCCAPLPPQLPAHSGRVVPCAYCAIAPEDGLATFVRSCSGGCDESV